VARRQFLSHMLSTRTVTDAAYNDQGKRPCDSGTRIDVLEDIKAWVNDIKEDSKTFLWLTGDPGCGKSAVTASAAQICKDKHVLWAQFFINRIGNTTNPAFYFPSIARQLADRSPEVALAIHDTLKEKPSLMDDISQLQAGNLFVHALKVASSTNPSKPVVVIIDALDETDPNRLRSTAEIFSQALVDLPRNAKIFISSRTEDDIWKPFSDTFHLKHVKHVHLDTSDDSSIQDVSTFLGKNIKRIIERHGLDALEWPGKDRFRLLCNQASGLFIWAVTAIKFIELQIELSGTECLDHVLDDLNLDGMGDINTLYGVILHLVHGDKEDPWISERFRRTVGCVVVLQQPLCLGEIRSLLDLRKTPTSTPVDLIHYIKRLRTVLVVGTNAIDRNTIP
jgi:AAA ATPase domain